MTKLLIGDTSAAQAMRFKILNIDEIQDLRVSLSAPLGDRFPHLFIQVEGFSEPLDYFEVGPLRIVSQEFRRVFEDHNVAAEFFPVSLTNGQGRELAAGYSFLHITGELWCLDEKNAVYTTDGDYVDRIARLAINELATEGRHLFRLAKSYDMPVLVSNRLAEEIEAGRLRGVVVMPLENWSSI